MTQTLRGGHSIFWRDTHVTRMSHTSGTSLVKRLSLAMVTRTFVLHFPAVWSENLNSAQDSDALLLQHGFVEEENWAGLSTLFFGFQVLHWLHFKISLVKDEWSLLLQRRIFKGMFERLF